MVEDKQYMVSEEAKRLEKKIYKMIGNIIDYDGKKLSMGTFKTLADIKNQVYLLTMESKTPIEPSDDVKKIIVKELREFILTHSKEIYDRCDAFLKADTDKSCLGADDFATNLLQKLPQPKQFNEAEIRDILETEISVTVHGDAYADIYIEDAVKELSTLTPKDNIKESKGTKGYHDVDKYYQD